ncbi:ArsR/SmtB family transcription factor [Specibacter sp. RAF43]|uniref:ArsR/SmtB family transcription factor n=1 Tax=Specibacter sp. RAF43 TaxID=3233057 RepID=UPI003F9D67B2
MVIEEVFAVIAEATRRDILEALAEDQKAVGQLVDELGVSQPTVSKHLRVLREAGVVTMRAQGQKRFYSINTAPLMLVSEWLDGLGAGPGASAAGAATVAVDGSRASSARFAGAGGGRGQALRVPFPAGSPVPETPAAPAHVVVRQGEHDASVPAQITRGMGRAANKAADLLANLPAFRRRRD